MSQIPQTPEGLGPEDFRQVDVAHPDAAQLGYRSARATRTSAWAIVSIICGIVGCLGFVTSLTIVMVIAGVVAFAAGVMGIRQTNDPRRTGRGLAIGGTVLGVLSILSWAFFGSTFTSVFSAAGEPRKLAQDFVKMASDGATELAMEKASSSFGIGRMETLARQMEEWGEYQDLTSHSSSIHVAGGVMTCELAGTAAFANEERPFTMTLVKQGDAWMVTSLEFD
ncbi:MAG: DUF4190 domain-containing protein [Tepidisphaeraceae bacterium]